MQIRHLAQSLTIVQEKLPSSCPVLLGRLFFSQRGARGSISCVSNTGSSCFPHHQAEVGLLETPSILQGALGPAPLAGRLGLQQPVAPRKRWLLVD